MPGRRQEDPRRVLQQLLRSDAEHHVLALRAIQLGDEDLEIRIERRAVEWVAIGFGELPENRVDGGLARAKRVLVAADPNGFHSGRELGTRHAGALTALLELSHEVLVAACRQPFTGMAGRSRSQALKETAARHRHGIPPSPTAGKNVWELARVNVERSIARILRCPLGECQRSIITWWSTSVEPPYLVIKCH